MDDLQLGTVFIFSVFDLLPVRTPHQDIPSCLRDAPVLSRPIVRGVVVVLSALDQMFHLCSSTDPQP